MRSKLLIRSGKYEDAHCLAALATQVWLHTYATDGITAEIAAYVISELTPGNYSSVLGDPSCHVFVAQNGNSLVGFSVIKFNTRGPVDSDSSVELQTLYVQENFIGHGVGTLLLRAAEAKARQRSNGALWLTVNAKNARAIAFYARHGYTMIGTTYFALGEGRHENHVLIGPNA